MNNFSIRRTKTYLLEIFVVACLFYAVAVFISVYDCNKKGGAYVHGQCLKAEVIK